MAAERKVHYANFLIHKLQDIIKIVRNLAVDAVINSVKTVLFQVISPNSPEAG